MTDFGSFARRLGEVAERQPRRGLVVDFDEHAAALERRRTRRGSIPIMPTETTVRAAEIEAAEAQHTLDMAEPDVGAARLDALRRHAGEARARAHRLRQAMEAA